MGRIRKLILLGGLMLLAIASYFGWQKFGPGYKRLTPHSNTWNVISHDGGISTELATIFNLNDVSDFSGFALVCDGNHKLTILINDLPVAELNGFHIHPSTMNEEVVVRPYYDVIPHLLDTNVRKVLKEGENSLRIFVQSSPGLLPDVKNWGLDARFCGFSVGLVNAPKFRGQKWKKSDNIPLIRLTVPGYEIPDEPKVDAELEFESDEVFIQQPIRIEARGRSSIGYDQKSFGFRIVGEDGKQSSVQFPGFEENSNFILYAPQMDLSLIRNALAYDLSRKMGHFAPRCIPVELIINNHYRGLYYLMEKIDISTERVPVQYIESDDSNARNNGFLVEINPGEPGDDILYTEYWNYILHRPGTPEMPKGDYKKIVAGQLDIMVSSVYRKLDILHEVIDYRSFADYIILQECSKNIDAYRLSTYFYKTHEDLDKLIYLGPVWDFNLAFGLSDEMQGRAAEGWIHMQHQVVDKFWTTLCEHPGFERYLKNRYRELRSDLLSDAGLNSQIDSLVTSIAPVRGNQFKRYPWPAVASWPYPEIHPSYESEIAAMKDFLHRRLNWMDEQWGR